MTQHRCPASRATACGGDRQSYFLVHQRDTTTTTITANTTTTVTTSTRSETEGTNFFHFIFYFIIYMLARRHLALRGALSTLEYMYIRSLDRLSAGLVSTG